MAPIEDLKIEVKHQTGSMWVRASRSVNSVHDPKQRCCQIGVPTLGGCKVLVERFSPWIAAPSENALRFCFQAARELQRPEISGFPRMVALMIRR